MDRREAPIRTAILVSLDGPKGFLLGRRCSTAFLMRPRYDCLFTRAVDAFAAAAFRIVLAYLARDITAIVVQPAATAVLAVTTAAVCVERAAAAAAD